jgi:hypothetical protein
MGKRALGLLVLSVAIFTALTATSQALCPVDDPDCGSPTPRFVLSVSRSQGTVTSAPTGINCPTDCTQSYLEDTEVTLTASSGPGGFSPSWTGCDSVTSSQCHVTMSEAKSVTLTWVDTTDPTVTLTQPASTGLVRGTIQLAATASDNAGIARVDFSVGGGAPFSDSLAPYGTSYDTTAHVDGDVQVSATAVDTNSRVSTPSSRSVTIDNTSPGLTVDGPDGGATFTQGSTQTWNLSASDANDVASVQCSLVGAGSPSSFGACSGGSSSHAATNLAPGNYTFSARATDNAGNVRTSAARNFTIAAPPNGGSGGQQQQGSVGQSISDAAIGDKLGADLKAGAKKLAKQKQKGLAKKGKYSVSVHALMAGKFTLSLSGAAGKAKASKSTKIATASKTATGAGTYKLSLKLTKAGKKLLRRGKRVKGKLTLSFTKQGGGKVARSKSLTLKRR